MVGSASMHEVRDGDDDNSGRYHVVVTLGVRSGLRKGTEWRDAV